MNIIIILLVISIIVGIHEFGHFIAAKLFGVPVATFAIGFPPTLLSWKRRETVYKLNLIPLGGYVNLTDPNNPDGGYDTGLFLAAWWKQVIILLAGIFFNLVTGFLVIWIMLMAGTKTPAPTGSVEIIAVQPDSAATDVLQSGDIVTGISGPGIQTPVEKSQDILDAVQNSKGKELTFTITRDNKPTDIAITPTATDDGYRIGVQMSTFTRESLPVGRAFVVGIKTTGSVIADTASALGHMVSGVFSGEKGALKNVSGPVGLISEGSKMIKTDPWVASINIFVLLSLNLALLNILPIPSLDGGQIIIASIKKISNGKVATMTANVLSLLGAGCIILLILAITYKDVLSLIKS